LIAPAVLVAYLSSCAPGVAQDTMRAIITVESSGNALALHDNDSGASYAPRDRSEATRLAEALIARGHSVDVGLAQVNSRNLAAYNVTAGQVLEPCENLRVGSAILAADYRAAAARFPDAREALTGAIGAYNTGSLFAGASYVRAVVAAASSPEVVPTIAILTRTPAAASPTMRPAPVHVVPTHGTWGNP
jgi:type IV secretion system protein VirB1